MSDQVGIEVWFKSSRDGLTERDHAALRWWLVRKIGSPLVRVVSMSGTRPDPRDPLSCRTYYGDGTYQWGCHANGQVRTGGGVRGEINAGTAINWPKYANLTTTPPPATPSPTHVSEGTET